MNARVSLTLACAAFLALGGAALSRQEGRVLSDRYHHLGNDTTKDWKEASPEPEGKRLELAFESAANAGEWTLFLEQRSIDDVWRVKLNDAEFAILKPFPALVPRRYAVPKGAVKAGANVLSFASDKPNDDAVIGKVRLVEQSQRELYDTHPVTVSVQDATTGALTPARVTFVDASGALAPIYYAESPRTAVRDGVLYVADQAARIELPRGKYTSYATRGSEWSCSKLELEVDRGAAKALVHRLRRELDTAGYVAVDTHVHTLQFSGHGDASADERQVTLAGEGVEFAVATDHNHHTDYGPYQRGLGFTAYYTAVTGNEVTTKVGHFNGFPLDPKAEPPPHKLEDYAAIVEGIRARGAQVVILNHPRWPEHDDSPFGNHALDRETGAFASGLHLPVDATELVNSTAEEADALYLFRDWFALLSRGVRVFAVGSSDSHTVGDPVGQGRTYVPSATDDPAAIDVGAACGALREGRSSIGMGIFATVLVGGRAKMGETLVQRPDGWPLTVELRVQAPSWVAPRKAVLYANGSACAELALDPRPGEPTDVTLRFEAPHDAELDRYLVCVVTGDAPGPFWPSLNPYTLAATNPVFVDADGDGWKSPRETALRWLEAAEGRADALARRAAQADDATLVHLLDLRAEALRSEGADAARVRREILDLASRGSQAHEAARRFAGRF